MAGNYKKDKHDIAITDVGTAGTGTDLIGMMLVEDRDNTPRYSVFDDEFLASQFFTGVPGYGSLPPEKEIAIRQDDWRSGFGLEIYDATEPKRYYKSINVDCRHRGMVICAPAAGTITKPTAPSADWVSPTGASGAGWVSPTLTYDGTTTTYAYEDIPGGTWGNFLELTTSLISCSKLRFYAGGEDVNINKIDLDAYYNGTWHDVCEGGFTHGTWTEKALDATCGVYKARVKFYNATSPPSDKDAYLYEFDFYQDPPTVGATQANATFNNEEYASFGVYLGKLSTAGTAFDLVADMGSTITDLEAFSDDNLYIALGSATEYYYMNTGGTITVTDSKALLFKAVGVTMWKALLPRMIYSATNPTTQAGWTGSATVDSPSYDILELLTDGSTLIIKKEDRTFYHSSTAPYIRVLIGETQHLAEATSGRCATHWQKKYYIGCGAQSLVEYDDGAISWRSPAKFCTNLSEFVGEVFAVAGDEEYLHAVVDNGTSVEVLAGRTETIDRTTGWVWHPLVEFPLTGCLTAFVSSKVEKRLYIASTLASDNLYCIALPIGYGDITNDANRNFQSGGEMWTPWLHGNFKGDEKAFIKLILTMEDTSDTVYFRAHYQKLGDAGWTEINPTTYFKTSPRTTGYIPVDASGNKPISVWIRFRFVPITGSPTSTPILKEYDCRGILYPPRRNIIACTVRCADDVTLRTGEMEKDAYDTIKTTLDNARSATWPVSIRDIDGETKTVKFLPLPGGVPRWSLHKAEKHREQERRYNLLMQEVDLS